MPPFSSAPLTRGLITTRYLTNDLENGTITLLLVRNFRGAVGVDLDTNNDGALDATPWDELAGRGGGHRR
jgi:hypothetical protein